MSDIRLLKIYEIFRSFRMLCWPVYIVGGFFISLLLVDLFTYSWDVLPYHAGLGIGFTGLYYLFCLFFGNDISMGVLFVPLIFILMFFFSSWIIYKNIQANKCCMTCDSGVESPDAFSEFWAWILRSITPSKPKCSKGI